MANQVIEVTGRPLTTLKHTCGDTAEVLDDVTGFVAQIEVWPASTPQKENVTACLITCETNDIKFGWGITPTQGATGLGHILEAGQSLRLTNHYAVANFTFINKTNGSNALLQITPEINRT